MPLINKIALSDKMPNVFRIVRTVRVVEHFAALVDFDTVLVDNPFDSTTVAKPIVVGFERDSTKRKEIVVFDALLVGRRYIFSTRKLYFTVSIQFKV